jgi:hypothetical protein
MNTKYTPNFNDPRVRTRCRQAIGFACGVMSATKSHAWSSRYIDKYFGSQRNELSRYLRDTLLICTDDFYRFNSENNKCKEYRLHQDGVDYLVKALGINTTTIYPSVVEVVKTDHKQELATGDFTYTEKSNRLWHPLQRYRRQYRSQILMDSGYEHDYDIAACAPTLIHQYAQHLGMDEYCWAIMRYLNEKKQVREELALALDLEVDAVKEVINALFAGAVISKHTESDIYHILAGDLARIDYLKQNEYVQELVSDIKKCWNAIIDANAIARRRNITTNRLIRVSCKNKWHVYFELERQIINSVRTYLDANNIRYFLLHDGWTCDQYVDSNLLEQHILNETDYRIRFEYKKLTQQYTTLV